MFLLRTYLLLGLLAHKAIWEVLKRNRPAGPVRAEGLKVKLVKVVKVAILLGLVAQILMPWYVLPLSDLPLWWQIGGAIVFAAGLMIAILGRVQLGDSWSDIESPHAASLISEGIYGYIRHPIYIGDILLLAGLELCLNSWLVLAVAALLPIVTHRAIQEERFLAKQNADYNLYVQRTKRFIPFLI